MSVPGRRLAFEERCEIKRGLARELSLAEIALRLGRPTSTVSREVARNGGRVSYQPWMAQHLAKQQRRRPKVFKLERHRRLARWVERCLAKKWSPEQIAERLRLDHPDDPRWWVSAETIYHSLFVQGRGGLREELRVHLRAKKRRRRDPNDGRGQLVDMVPISERPPEVADRAVPGHWEGDLILGGDGRSALGTLVERQTRYALLFVLRDGHTAEAARAALTKVIATLPAELRRSLTWDQGKEMAQHVRFRVDTGVDVYFCDPGKPWQRGTNENTNGLLRQYFPKGSRFTDLTDAQARAVARELNGRPRKTLGWRTPAEALAELIHSAA
jgi:IS30 family transposase